MTKAFRELNDGLGTVVIDLQLSHQRLHRLQEIANSENRAVDGVINDAINQYLILSDIEDRRGISVAELAQKADELEEENKTLKATLIEQKRARRREVKKLKRGESSNLQIYLPFILSGMYRKPSLGQAVG